MEGLEAPSLDTPTTFDEWGVECGDGWFILVDGLAKAVEEEIARMFFLGVESRYWPRVAQIKQKFGRLRFRVRGPLSARLRAQVRAVEEESYSICGNCGGPRDIPENGNPDADCQSCEATRLASNAQDRESVLADQDQFYLELQRMLDSRPE